MTHLPDFETFESLCDAHDLIPVYRRLVSDTMTPVTAFHRLDDGGSACLFESVIVACTVPPLQLSSGGTVHATASERPAGHRDSR